MRAQGVMSPHAHRLGAALGVRTRWRVAPASDAPSVLPATWTALAAVGLIVGLSMLVGMVGADARWLAALGGAITRDGRIPVGVPFAAASTIHWHNVTVMAELIFWALESALGDRGLVLAQGLAILTAFVVVSRDAGDAGAARQATASTCLVAALGVAPSLAIVRVQLFSLALFPILLMLLRADARRPSRRIWFAPVLLGLWSNLHGAVLVGLLVTLVYLVLTRLRRRPLCTLALAGSCLGALCANPAGLHALAYYQGVLGNAGAQRGEGMWGALSPTSPADALLIAAVVVLAQRAWRARPSRWELVVVVLLGAMTLHASRSGLWLVLALVTPAAVGTPAGSPWRWRGALVVALAVGSFAVGVARGPSPAGADARTIARAMALAGESPILASDIPAEQIALAGGRVWASDPIDALPQQVQVAYLEWMDGEPAGLASVDRRIRVVLVMRPSSEATMMERTPGFRLVSRAPRSELFERTGTGID